MSLEVMDTRRGYGGNMRSIVRRAPRLQRFAVFESVARTGSFTAAAHDLQISQPAVSRHMRSLTDELGVELYKKAGRSFALTSAGQILADALNSAFATVEQALDRIGDDPGALIFAVQSAMATSWVVPLLDQLETAAGCEIRLRIYDREPELDTKAWDLAIVPGEGRWAGWNSTCLFHESVRPLAAPSLASELNLDEASSPQELLAATLLHIDSVERPAMTWPQWFAESGSKASPPKPRLVYNTYPTVIQEALAGNGVVLGWKHLLDGLVERGLLVPVGPSVERDRVGHYMCWPSHLDDSRRQAVLEHLQDEIGSEP